MNPPQHRPQTDNGQYGDDNRQKRAQNDLRGKGAAHPLLVVLTQLVGSHDGKSGGTAESELQKDKSQRERIVDAGHFLRTERSAADCRIAKRINLLQKIGQNDRNRKHD